MAAKKKSKGEQLPTRPIKVPPAKVKSPRGC